MVEGVGIVRGIVDNGIEGSLRIVRGRKDRGQLG